MYSKDAKTTQVLIIIFGGILSGMALMNLMTKFIIHLVSELPSELNYYFFFMPFLLLIGIAYIILGIKLFNIKERKLKYHITISIILIIWTICWIIYNFIFKENVSEPNSPLNEVGYTIAKYISIIVGLLIIIIPQIFIGFKLNNLDKVHSTT